MADDEQQVNEQVEVAATEADDASEQIATPVVAGDESLPATPAVEQDADAEIAQETAAETENNEDTPGPDDSSRPVTETPDVRDITPGGDATPAAEEGEQTEVAKEEEAREAAEEDAVEKEAKYTDGENVDEVVADIQTGVEITEGDEGETEEEQPVEGDQQVVEGDHLSPEEGQMEGISEGEEEKGLESDQFGEGDREDSPVVVGERLSREGTPTGSEQMDLQQTQSPPVPETPNESDEEEEEEDEEEEYEDEPEYDREQLLEQYQQAMQQRQQLHEQNLQMQHKLSDYFRKKKSEDMRQEVDKNVADQEQRYLKYMANLEELRQQDGTERMIYRQQIQELKERCQDKQELVEEERGQFLEFKKQVALNAVNSRSGKPIFPRDIEQYLQTENKKEAEVVNVRLENIKLKNKLKKKEYQLKSKEELAEGLHLIDFEQLKIENQTYNEKIEERNECGDRLRPSDSDVHRRQNLTTKVDPRTELLKLRKKITSTVQVLTHLKEKLQFVQAENQVQRGRLQDVEQLASRKRDILSRTKQARDALRIDNQRLKQSCGLLGNEPLLRDFEERKDETDTLQERLDGLKMMHSELTLNLSGVRHKIEQAKVAKA